MVKAVFPGSFDPPTNGHLNIIERASTIFDSLDVVIAVNEMKSSFFSGEERLSLMEELLAGYDNVRVTSWNRLIVDYVAQSGTHVLLRGVRAMSDFGHEFELAMMNKSLNHNVQTILIPTDPKYFVLRSSVIKEIASFGGDISSMVPIQVEIAVKRKLGYA